MLLALKLNATLSRGLKPPPTKTMKEIQRLFAKLESAGKARPKQDPYYGKARRLAKKMGADIEVDCGAIWISVDRKLASHDGNPWGDYMRGPESWHHAYQLLCEFAVFQTSLEEK